VVHGSSEETEAHWHFKCLFKAGDEVSLFTPNSTPTNKVFYTEHSTPSALTMPGLHAWPSICPCLCPPCSVPGKKLGRIDSTCLSWTLWHVPVQRQAPAGPGDLQGQQVSEVQQVSSTAGFRLHMQH